ncbi:MAG: TetR/AcrR family transcriptional regulator [Gammaproteobacteria bacterium]|nr:TetR/AcrR family transcriptional regulator [Gammaproteobacteria bacterium]MBU1442440.1 TetR/AcrR family transcriptional regulator [Gammaproteobacteria bacterium]MBU2411036.1 TetR/AcrR family transcriptional regulator [Gammaproteobacteria bacterium]
MARPREFDENTVLDAAVRCFWRHGFGGTSVRDLAKDMGLTSASLYNAFGDKRALYAKALEHYLDRGVRARIAQLEGVAAPRAAIAAFFDEIIERSVGDSERRGCLLVNAALDVAPHDAVFQRAVATELRLIESFFRRSVQAGQRVGDIAVQHDADDLARLLLSLLLGLRVLARSRPERALLEGAVRPALALLDVHPLDAAGASAMASGFSPNPSTPSNNAKDRS